MYIYVFIIHYHFKFDFVRYVYKSKTCSISNSVLYYNEVDQVIITLFCALTIIITAVNAGGSSVPQNTNPFLPSWAPSPSLPECPTCNEESIFNCKCPAGKSKQVRSVQIWPPGMPLPPGGVPPTLVRCCKTF